MTNRVIYTIGHSTHELDSFLKLLVSNSVNCVIDVRSTPFSARVPQFNKDILHPYLDERGVVYLHFPKAFGARQRDPKLLDETGRVDFEKVRQSANFREGLDKLRYCVEQGFTITLMCAEANPLDCHRFGMISYQLVKEGFLVKHILKNGGLMNNSELEKMMLDRYSHRLAERSLFLDDGLTTISQIDFAYRLRNKEIGFSINKRA